MLRRTGATTLVVAAIALGVAPPAHAEPPSFLGSVECGSSGGGGCAVMIEWWLKNNGGGGTGGSGSGGTDAPSGGSEWDSVDWDAVDWDAVDWESVDWDAIDWESIDYDGTDGEDEVDPETLAGEAMASLNIPAPDIATSPGVDSQILVHTPVWLWLEPDGWEAESAVAADEGFSAEVTAAPVRTKWTLGDGTEIVCEGPGTPYDPAAHDPASESPDCGHVYTRSSDAEPGGAFPVKAEVTWDIGWNFSDGQNGTLGPVVVASEVELTVKEAQSLVTGVGQG
ncbi:hypothetical protein [Actinorugispora endophytica]|uniref:ATP/GTP-binding protein n=1 Tax=Actinorugispora endophytica TaxID=1605990 RepID=A0A4R6V7L9_9ACTN|nr:hypothetical protein [Actinorugispora endophytica]TDQ55106.1 hypothetical protein EV190_101429 [Actinorugispora endophytica]